MVRLILGTCKRIREGEPKAAQHATSFDLSVECSIYTDFREEYWSAIFRGVSQHLNGMPPFRNIPLKSGELPDEVVGISQSSGWPPSR
jgi:hypothetical protein